MADNGNSTAGFRLYPFLNRIPDGVQTYSVLFLVINVLAVSASLALFFYNINNPYLKVRGKEGTALIALAWFCVPFMDAAARITSEDPGNVLGSCGFTSGAFAMVLFPSNLGHQTRLFTFYYAAKLNKAISIHFEQEKKKALGGVSLATEYQEELVKLRHRASISTGRKVAFAAFLFSIFLSFLFAIAVCESGFSTTLLDFQFMGIFFGFQFAFTSVKCWILRFCKDLPDIFGILEEQRTTALISIVLLFPMVIVGAFDPAGIFDADSEEDLTFSYWFVLEVVCFFYYLYAFSFQAYKASKFVVSEAVSKFTLSDVIEGSAKEIFRAYLVKELSVENINFYEMCDTFVKSMHDPSQNPGFEPKVYAMTLFEIFIRPGSPQQVNLEFSLVDKLDQDIKRGHITTHMFDTAQMEIFTLMENDSFGRFLKSKEFSEWTGMQEIAPERLL